MIALIIRALAIVLGSLCAAFFALDDQWFDALGCVGCVGIISVVDSRGWRVA